MVRGTPARGLFAAGALAPWMAACSIDSRVFDTQQESLEPDSSGAGGGPVTDMEGGGQPDVNRTVERSGDAAEYRLTVLLSGPASGKVISSVPAIDCGTVCTGLFSGPVALSARTRDGDDAFFVGWANSTSGSACNGPKHDCSLLMDHDQTVTANFAPMDHNLIFVSSKTYPPSLGGVPAYDAECNALASAAGINDAAGSGFIALMSDFGDYEHPVGDILDRIGAARGWVRLDGLPVADEAAALVAPAQHFPPNLTEQGAVPVGGSVLVWTGLGIDQLSDDHCGRWTEARPGSSVMVGASNSLRWSGDAPTPCDALNAPIYCVGTTKQQPLESVPRFEGKRIWLTTTRYASGSSTPDQKCRSERPTGVAQAAAFIAYSGRLASEVIDLDAMYVLSDGRRVGTGAQLLSGQVEVGPWLLADGTPVPAGTSAWVGSLEAWMDPGTLETTCRDWTSDDANLSGFTEWTGYPYLGRYGAPLPCNYSSLLYCVEP